MMVGAMRTIKTATYCIALLVFGLLLVVAAMVDEDDD
jgi:hypothetical protein